MPRRRHSPLPRRLADELRSMNAAGTLLLAVSGGADSVALLRASAEIAGELGIELIVGHMDHGLRGNSHKDAEWVAEQARMLGQACRMERLDVATEAARIGRGIEETARRMRYDWLANVAREAGASCVATAHTANDAAETILFHLLRGTGLAGLRGIARTRRLATDLRLIRPMLDISRAEVLEYLQETGQDFREDPTNTDLDITRNRIRHEILPELRETINPRVDEALIRLSRQAHETQALLARIARSELKKSLIETGATRIRLDIRDLGVRRPIVIRETLRLAWKQADWPRQAMTADHWDALALVVREGGRRTLPGGIDARARDVELILSRPEE